MPRILRPALVVVALLLSLVALPVGSVRAATIVITDQASCEAIGGRFGHFGDCTYDSHGVYLATGDLLQLALHTNTATLTNNGTIQIATGYFLTTYGQATNNGTITVASNGRLRHAQGPFTNNGTITVASGATLSNFDTFTNTGTITMASGAHLIILGPFTNTGTITLACGGTVSGPISGNQPVFLACDTTPPVITGADITVTATGPAGAIVTFTPTATDENPTSPTVTCDPASGSTFAVGTTTVTCTARDAAGNIGRASFTVTVQPAIPTSKEQCKNGGYAQFTDPATGATFRNQGRCIQFVNTGK